MNTKKLLASMVLASGGLLAANTYAAPIPSFNWTTDGGFVIGSSTCSNGGEAACNIGYVNTNPPAVTPSGIAGTASIMTWGTGSTLDGGNGEQSGLQGVFGATGDGGYNAQLLSSGPVTIPMFDPIITNGGWTNTGAAVHYNNVISTAGGYMNSSTLRTTFQLLTPVPGLVNATNIDIGFNETPNTLPCGAGNPHGTVCDDVFTITQLPPPIDFYFGKYKYTISFRFQDGPGSIVSGDGLTIWTAEDAPGTAVMFTQAQITGVAIPVPGALALMGMGLMLLGWRVRDRKVA